MKENKSKNFNNEVKTVIKEIKFYLPILLIIPPVLGGLWQLLELFRIDPSFVRFFSVTQLLPDGLLMLPIVISLLSFLLIPYTYMLNHIFIKYKFTTQKPKNLKLLYIAPYKTEYREFCLNELGNKNAWIKILFIFTIVFALFLFGVYSHITKEEISLGYIIFTSFFFILIMSFYIQIIVLAWKCCKSNIKIYISKKIKNSFLKEIFSLLHIILLIIVYLTLALIPLIIMSTIHNEYIFPDKLENMKNLEKLFQQDDYNSSKILYLNDKYIFIEHEKNNQKKTIEIVKFDKLFN